jgi:CdiA C-terminal tRNase domain
MATVAAIPELSQLLSWPTEHLTEAADHWEAVGARSYGVAHQVWRDALSVDWQGQGAEALRTATHTDMRATSGVADQLQAAAKTARGGASDLHAARSRLRYAVRDANAAGFDVDEEMSVIDRSAGGSAAQRTAREAQAQSLAADIRHRAVQLVALDHEVAGRVTAAVAGIRDTLPQSPASLTPRKPEIYGVDNHTFKQDPAPQSDETRDAYERLKTQIRDHNAVRPSPSDASAVAAYNREADALNARKAELEAKLGKVETAPAKGTRLVPDWAQPAPEPLPGHPKLSPEHAPFDLTTPHAHDLGVDPANGSFRMSEAETGLRVEAETGIDLVRSRHPGADWINPATGETYDAVGNFPSRFFDAQWPNLQEKIRDHLRIKAVYVPVDVSQFTAEQRSIVRAYIEALGDSHVFIVGDH